MSAPTTHLKVRGEHWGLRDWIRCSFLWHPPFVILSPLLLWTLFSLNVAKNRKRPPLSNSHGNCLRPTSVFKEENRYLSRGTGPFAKEKSLVFATALSDPSGSASAIYGVSRTCPRWGQWIENNPCWFVIDRRGTLTFAAHATFAVLTHLKGHLASRAVARK